MAEPRMVIYSDVRQIGVGGFAEVWECKCDEDGETYAKKKLTRIDDPEAVNRFKREVRIISKLDHPNIVQILATRLHDAPYFYVMPRFEGSLDSFLNQYLNNEVEINSLLDSLLAGLEYAHNQGVIHRDINPRNILINRSHAQTVVISDFGLGRDIDSESTIGVSFPRYPAYRHSGVDWLGDLPSHWAVTPLKRDTLFVTSGARGWAENYSDDGDLFLRIGNLTRTSIGLDLSDTQRVSVEDGSEGSRTKVRAGDVLFSITAYLGSVAVVPEGLGTAFVSQHVALVRLRQERLMPDWVAYVASSYIGKTYLETQGYGGTKIQLSLGDVASLLVTSPPLEEQKALTQFLSHETAKIDALVDEQKRLIELLKEKRQVVILQAVTKGLDPRVPMKDSGVEWFGAVPAHWDVRSLRTLSSVVRGASPRPAGDPVFFNGDHIPWVTVAEITKDELVTLEDTETCLTQAGAEQSRRFRSGTVVYSNSGATLGVPKILCMEACANDGVVGFENLSELLLPRFLYFHLNSITKAVREMVKQGSGQPNLNTGLVKSFPIALPPVAEQLGICAHIEAELSRFQRMSDEAELAMKLLDERRSALISAAVTGKIDVRDLAPKPEPVAA